MIPPKRSLVSLSGYARTGKDTVAKILGEEYGFVRVAFADAVRKLAADLYGLPSGREWWDQHKNKAIDPQWSLAFGSPRTALEATNWHTYRGFLNHVGMQLRHRDPEFWLRIGLDAVDRHLTEGRRVVVTDARFANEVTALWIRNAQCWRLKRSGALPLGIADLAVDLIPTHMFEATIDNDNQSVADLRALVISELEAGWARR